MPLSALGAKDKIAWKMEREGQYTVSSRYNLVKKLRKSYEGEEETSTAAIDKKKLWSRFWGLNVKKKILHFLWQSMNNSLPVLQNVAKRGMKCSPIYSRCGEEVETVVHVMFECRFAQTC